MGSDNTALPPKLAKAILKDNIKKLVEDAKKLYQDKLSPFVKDHLPPAFVAAAPGRVNLIGEHTDYTGGFVLPLAIDKSTVIYGTGFVHTGKGAVPTSARVRMVSLQAPDDAVEERKLVGHLEPPAEDEPRSWVDYVVGTIAQYMEDLPEEGCVVDFAMAYASDVPLGSGLSSSAALEVATAAFMEQFLKERAYCSTPGADPKVERAIRCQKAENDWAHAPCGIMDQLTSSAAEEGNVMLIDCRSLEITHVPIKTDWDQRPCMVVCNSKVEHEIADGEYGKRRHECNDALEAMQAVPLYHVLSLRDATLQDVKDTFEKGKMGEIPFKRAKHVVTENQRTRECKTALKLGVWDRVGELMNASHASLRDDFEVSCEEIDMLVETAQKHPGVFGSRITGGGFGGCTITLVKRENSNELMEKLKEDYKEKTGKECECFIVHPSAGASVLAMDMDCKAK